MSGALLPAQTHDQAGAWSGPYEAGGVWAVLEGRGEHGAVDAVMMLRVQHERMSGGFFPTAREYTVTYGLTRDRMRRLVAANPDVVVLHPGPMNRGLEIAADVAACAAAGASVFHLHPRAMNGRESLAAADVDRLMGEVRARAPHVSIGLTTGAWIVPEPALRLEAISRWQQLPDFASVNFDEEGCEAVARLLVARGIGVEAGVLDVASTKRL